MYSTRTDKTQRERDLEYEIERYREAEERQQQEQERQRQQRHREWSERHEEHLRSAANWQEALRKQIYLCRREIGLINDDTPPAEDYFEQSARACERALEIWEETQAARQPEVEALHARLAAIQDDIQSAVADRVEQECPTPGGKNVAYSIRNQDPEAFLDW